MAVTRQVSWGEGLMVEMSKVPGGLNALVTAIRSQFGVVVGSRNTFKKLYDVQDPNDLPLRDQFRAWLLLAAVGQEPTEWGLSVTCVPPAVALDGLFERLRDARTAVGVDTPAWSAIGPTSPYLRPVRRLSGHTDTYVQPVDARIVALPRAPRLTRCASCAPTLTGAVAA